MGVVEGHRLLDVVAVFVADEVEDEEAAGVFEQAPVEQDDVAELAGGSTSPGGARCPSATRSRSSGC